MRMRRVGVQSVVALSVLLVQVGWADTAWVRRYEGPFNDATTPYGPCLAVDPGFDKLGYRDVVVVGAGTDVAPVSGFLTRMYHYDGSLQWSATYDGLGYGADTARAVCFDSTGMNARVTGSSVGDGTGQDYATITYEARDGIQSWVARYDGPAHGDDVGLRVVSNPHGVHVTGYSQGVGTDEDFATVKYSGDGAEQWVARYDGLAHKSDRAYALDVNYSTGNVYAGGYGEDDSVSGRDYVLVKYDGATGAQRWVVKYNGPASGPDEIRALALDRNGNICVTGNSWESGYDIVTIKYDASGNRLWVSRYDGPAQADDVAADMTVDHYDGYVYVVGTSAGTGTDVDYVTMRLDPADGTTDFVKRYNNDERDGSDRAYGVALDWENNLYVTGSSCGNGNDEDFCTIKYDSSGEEVWVERYNGPANGADRAHGIAAAAEGSGLSDLYVAGESWGGSTEFDIALVSYHSAEAVEEPPSLPGQPTRVATVVRSLPAGAVVFDAMGRRVANPRSGIFFVREEPQPASSKPQGIRKTIIAE